MCGELPLRKSLKLAAKAAKAFSASPMAYSVSKSFVNAKAKRRQYKRTASEADKVHG
jgi:hypothetical protein